MLNEETTKDSELDLQVTTDSESPDSSQSSEFTEGENEDSQLNLETDKSQVDKLTPAEEQAKRQEEHWMLEVSSGRKELEDAPAWIQKRITPRLEGSAPDTEEVVRKVLEKEREDAQFQELQATIPALTPQQAQELQDRYKTLRPAGKLVALAAALDAMGISSKLKEAEQRGVAKGRVSLARSGQPSVKKSEDTVQGVPRSLIQDNAAFDKFIKNAGS